MADETGKPSSKMLAYFLERAGGGVGLITSGMMPVSWEDDPTYGDLDATGIFPRLDLHRTVFAGWRAIAEGCHAYGARFFVQLAPCMGRVGSPECLLKKRRLPVSSSWNPNWYLQQVPCRPLLDRECRRIIRHTGQAALDAKEIGIDGVYLHGHSGYLIEQMTDPAYNRRRLGRYSDWQRFGIELVQEIRERCGNAYPIYYRIDLSLCLRETYKEKMDQVKALKKFRSGRTVEMTLDYMEKLVRAGVDAFDVDLGGYENWWLPHPPIGLPVEGVTLPHVIQGVDFLSNPEKYAAAAQDAVVIGGSDVGCEIAYLLSYERNKKVTVVEMLPYLMKKTCTSNRYYMIHHLAERGVKLLNCTALKRIMPRYVELEQNVSEAVPDPYMTWTPVLPENIPDPFAKEIRQDKRIVSEKADLVILCTGARPDGSLYEACVKGHIAAEIFNIGDSFAGGRVLEAVKAGYRLGISL